MRAHGHITLSFVVVWQRFEQSRRTITAGVPRGSEPETASNELAALAKARTTAGTTRDRKAAAMAAAYSFVWLCMRKDIFAVFKCHLARSHDQVKNR